MNKHSDQIMESPAKAGLKWLFLDLNSYFASVEQQHNPALRGKPVAVVPAMTDSTCAIAASYEAKAFGIRTGTKIYEAKKMCPSLICIQADHKKYVDYHHQIIAATERCLPVHKTWSVDEFDCLLLGREREPANAIALANAAPELKLTVLDQVNGIGAAFGDFVEPLDLHVVPGQVLIGAAGGVDLKSQFQQLTGNGHRPVLVAVANRKKDVPFRRQRSAGRHL